MPGAGRAGCRHWRRRPAGSPHRARPPAPRCPRAPASRRGRSRRRRRRSPACRPSPPAAAPSRAAAPCRAARNPCGRSIPPVRPRAHGSGTGLAGGRGANRPNSSTSSGRHARHDGGAIAALAAPHADPALALQPSRRVVAGRDLLAQLARCHLLAAADDGAVGDRAGIEGRRLEQPPQRAPGSAAERPRVRRAAVGCGTFRPRSRRDRRRGDDALRPGGMGAAEARAVADGEDLGDAGAALRVGERFHRAAAARHEAVRAAQRARQPGRGGEAVAQRHDVGVDRQDRPPRPRAAPRPPGASPVRPQCSSALAAAREPQAFDQQAGSAEAAGAASRATGARPGRGAASSTATTSAPPSSSSAASLQVQRAVAGDHHAPARRHAIGARQGLQPARPSSRPAGSSPAPAPTVRRRRSPAPGAWAERVAAAGHDGRDLVRARRPPRPWPRSGSARRPAARLAQRMRRRGTARRGSRLGLVRGRQRLEILPAGMQPLVEHHHVGAGAAAASAADRPAGPGAHHQHVAGDLLAPARRLGCRRRRRRLPSGHPCRPRPWPGRRAGRAGRRSSPGSRSRRPCRIEARAARRAGLAVRRRCRGRQRRGDRLARQRLDRASVEADADRAAAGRMAGCVRRMERVLQGIGME